MTVTEGRFNKLEERVTEIGERIAKVEGGNRSPDARHGTWTVWLPIGVPVVALIAVMTTVGIHLDNKIGSAQGRLGKIEDAVKVLGDNQNNQTKQIVHDLLAAARNANPQVASRILGTAASLVAVLQAEKRRATPKFFETGIRELDQVDEVHNRLPAPFLTRIAFAPIGQRCSQFPKSVTQLHSLPLSIFWQ